MKTIPSGIQMCSQGRLKLWTSISPRIWVQYPSLRDVPCSPALSTGKGGWVFSLILPHLCDLHPRSRGGCNSSFHHEVAGGGSQKRSVAEPEAESPCCTAEIDTTLKFNSTLIKQRKISYLSHGLVRALITTQQIRPLLCFSAFSQEMILC